MITHYQSSFSLPLSASPHTHAITASAPLPRFSLLRYYSSSFTSFASAVGAFFRSVVDRHIPAAAALVGVVTGWSYARDCVWRFVEEHLMSSVRIRTNDELYSMVMQWMSSQPFAQSSRHFLASTDMFTQTQARLQYLNREYDEENERSSLSTQSPEPRPFEFTPGYGSHFFWYKGHALLFGRHQNSQKMSYPLVGDRDELTLSSFGRDPAILKELLAEARELHMKNDERKTLIYRGNLEDKAWKRCSSRLSRPFDTVILNQQVKQDLLTDATDYLSPFTRRWYANRGIPYRRGYLFHGPPGTGKTSLSLALAGFFRMKIFIVSFSSAKATEDNIMSLFNQLPTHCIVLLEDIDSAGVAHSRDENYTLVQANNTHTPSSSPVIPSAMPPAPDADSGSSGRMSLSGLLNILDGVASQEGRILIMTTNHVEKLDPALTRPGRVDMVVPFGLADAVMIASIFRAMYALYSNENELLVPGAGAVPDVASTTGQRAGDMAGMSSLVERFVGKIPECEFTPAEIQGLLLRHKHRPEDAIEAADAWVASVRGQRKAWGRPGIVEQWDDVAERQS